MGDFDFAWAYVRPHPDVITRLNDVGTKLILGPNVLLENAHRGISDEFESWLLNSNLNNIFCNLNVASYYTRYVKSLSTNNLDCKTLEYCYDSSQFLNHNGTNSQQKDIDVLLYKKVRINDTTKEIDEKIALLFLKLKKLNLNVRLIEYGNYKREDFISLCRRSKVVAWMCIEDYCSLAQIEAHLCGACVVGTDFNLTIPITDVAICKNSQVMTNEWIKWIPDNNIVVDDYFETILKTLEVKDLASLTVQEACNRHSFERYRTNLLNVLK